MSTIALSLLIGTATTAAYTLVPLPHIDIAATVDGTGARGAVVNAAAANFADGTYTGPSVDAYYGQVQVQATVQNGQIVSLKMLRYPSDRRESLIISQQALPLLRNEVVRAQTAKVDIVSGATLTSQAFVRSLAGALGQAGGTQAAPANPPPATGGGRGGNSIGI